MSNYLSQHTKQSPPTQGTVLAGQIPNSDGGAVYSTGVFERLNRFLILGSEGGSFYASERDLTLQNVESAEKAIAEDGLRVVQMVRECSLNNRAPKQDPAIFVLALASVKGDENTRANALLSVPQVCRTGTTLFQFLEFRKNFGKLSGRALRNAIAAWYNTKRPDQLALQLIKYRQRHNWTHPDALRVGHVQPSTAQHNALFRFARNGFDSVEQGRTVVNERSGQVREYGALEKALLPKIIHGFVEIQKPGLTAKKAAELISAYKLPREAVPTELLNERVVWEALLEDMPATALIRNLATITRLGMLERLSDTEKKVISALGDHERFVSARVHPVTVLIAQRTYSSGRSLRGENTWKPNQYVVDALEELFYGTFPSVQPSGKNIQIALDVSASMSWPQSQVMGIPRFFAREASAAMALVTVNREPNTMVTAFSGGITVLDKISPTMRLNDVVSLVSRLPANYTNCSLPMTWAQENRRGFDSFVIYTDNETNAFTEIQPAAALKEYRRRMNTQSRLIVAGMVATDFTIADPNDPLMLDVVGFSNEVPSVISEFTAGRI